MYRLLWVLLLMFPGLANTNKNSSLIEKEVELVIVQGVKSYALPDSFVLLGSEAIEISGISIDTSLYRIDHTNGIIEVPDSLGSRMEVRYEAFPFCLKPEYYHRKRMIDRSTDAIIEEPNRQPSKEIRDEGVRIGGKKTFSFSAGSRDEPTLNQSLELRLGGKISGVAVNGILSDKDSDLGGGGTKSIEELDNVYVEAEADHFKCRIGDYDFIVDGNRFCHVERKLEGVIGSAFFRGIDMMAAGAVTRSRFITGSFPGEDGKQGPYKLSDSEGTGCFNLVRGSEKVYLDGELLERGEAKDYIIDYELGTIEFTPRRLITSESRLVVDFQHSADGFQKRVYGAEASVGLPNRKLRVIASLFTEEDSPETSLHTSFGDKMREELSRAGSETVEVWVDGGELVGEKDGDYLKLDSHYEFVGSNSGNYNVSFTHVGKGKGDYAYDQERGGYEWVGDGSGSYVAQIRVPLPQSKSLYDLKLTYSPISDLSMEYEHAFSRTDLNTHSTLDEVRRSQAHSLEFALQEKPIGWGKLTFSTRLWNIGTGFMLSSSEKKADRWHGRSNSIEHRAEEMEAVYSLPFLKMGISLSGAHFPDGGSSRKAFETTLNPGGLSHAFFSYESIMNRDGEGVQFTKRKTVGLGHQLWHFSPSLLYGEELQNSEKSRKYGFLVDLVKLDRLCGRYEHTIVLRDGKESAARWIPESKEFRDILALSLDAEHSRAEFHYTHRSKRYQQLPGENLDYSLVSLSISSRPIREKVEFAVNSLLTSKRSQQKEVAYIRVDEGEGQYMKDPETGDYYVYDSGDYVREVVWTGHSEPVLGLKVEFQSRLEPNETFTLFSRLLTDKEVRKRDELLRLKEGKKLRNFLDNALEISSPNQKISLRLSHKWSRNLEQSEEETEERRAFSANVDGGRVGFVIGGSEELSRSSFSTHVRREEKKRRVEGTEIFKCSPFTFSFLEGVESKQVHFPYCYQSLGWIRLSSIFVRPSIEFEIPFRSSLESSVELSFSTSPQQIPYILTITDPPGWGYEWITILNYWLNRSMSSTFIYQGEKKGADVNHKLKVEVRGYF